MFRRKHLCDNVHSQRAHTDRARDILIAYEAADALGYEIQHVRRLLLEGKIDGEKIGRDSLINRAAIMQYLPNREASKRPLRS